MKLNIYDIVFFISSQEKTLRHSQIVLNGPKGEEVTFNIQNSSIENLIQYRSLEHKYADLKFNVKLLCLDF